MVSRFDVVALLLATTRIPLQCDAAVFERQWWSSRDSLSDFEPVRSHSAYSEMECTAMASHDADVQLVTFNEMSGLCTLFRCRLGLDHCKKCRCETTRAHKVWAARVDCWLTVQHRVSGSVDFYRNWSQYQSGFGEGPDGNYWIGLETLHQLTLRQPRKLRIIMKLWNGTEAWAEYSSFSVGPGSDNYRLSVSGFSASAGVGDSLINGDGMRFSTSDADHDLEVSNCASEFMGAWWFRACHDTHPNGQYKNIDQAMNGPYAQGIIWSKFFGFYYSLPEIEILLL